MAITRKKLFAGVVLLLFAASLCMPAFYTDGAQPDGWSSSPILFLLGWMGMLGEPSAVAWLANPLFVLAFILFLKNKKAALPLSLAAVLFAASFLRAGKIMVSERPDYARITVYAAGYWLWLMTMIALFAFSVVVRSGSPKGTGEKI